MAAEIASHANILIELTKAVKMHNFYPQGHPHLELALERCFAVLKEKTASDGDIRWKVDQNGVYTQEKTPILGDSEEALSLAKRLFFRRIKEIAFIKGLQKEDLRFFIGLLWKEPEDIKVMGGVEKAFAKGGVSGILLNEMRYEDLLNLKRELEERKEKEKDSIKGARTAEASGEEGEDADLAMGGGIKLAPEQTLQELIERIKGETDFLRYNDLTVRIREKVFVLLEERMFGEAVPALLVLAEHGFPSSGLPEDLRALANETVDSFLTNDDLLRTLAWSAGSVQGSDRRTVIQEVLLRRGEKAAELVLEVLVDVPDAAARRNLFNTAVLFGKKIIPGVIRRLRSEKWYEVRQMCALLGEIGDPANIDHLIEAYGNEDPRIKKEVLKSLARTPSPRSTESLLEALGEEDPSLSTQAIVSLGMLRDPAAIPSLAGIALKWEPFSDSQEPMKEAIKALGIIGDQKANEYLVKLLFRRKLFGKGINSELRVLAAKSLGMIGGDEAFKALEKACKGSDGELLTTCTRILESRQKEG